MKNRIKCLLVIATTLVAMSIVAADFPDPDPVMAGGFDIMGVFILFTIFIGSLYTVSKRHVNYT